MKIRTINNEFELTTGMGPLQPNLYTGRKSLKVAIGLCVLFGPLGLFYVLSPGLTLLILGGVAVMAAMTKITWFLAGWAFTVAACAIYSSIAVGEFNDKLTAIKAEETNRILLRDGLR